jgi:putative ABC transport system permease protein
MMRLTGFWQDVRYAVRGLVNRPGFTAAVVATIALGVGANAAIFSVVDAALLRPLPYAQPDRLVHLAARAASIPGKHFEASYPELLDIRRRTTTLAAVAGYHSARITLATGDRALVLAAGKVTANFFDVLGVTPLAGRRFAPGEDDVGSGRVALLTHGLWLRAFAGDRGIIGRVVRLDGVPFTVAGVLPAGFQFAGVGSAEVWVPIDRPVAMRERRGMHWIKPVARLREGATLAAAQRDLSRIMGELAAEYPETNAGEDGDVVALRDELVGVVRPLLLTLYGAVGLVLLVACGNVANLLLMRGAGRQRELTIRAALGAGRGRIAQQLFTESALLALAGGALGVLVAYAAIRGLVAAIPPEQARALPYLQGVGVSAAVLGYAALLSLGVAVAAGLLPALKASRPALQATLRQGSGGSASGARLLRDGLVVAELAMTVVLVSGAALFARSLASLLAVDTGVQSRGVLTMMVPLPRWQYATEAAQRRFYQALEERVAALPGVQGVGLTSKLPLDYGNSTGYEVVGAPPQDRETTASFRVVNPQYFATLGIPLVRGRIFSAGEDSAAQRVVLINRTMAREAFGERDPVGRQLRVGGAGDATVVGVVGDVAVGKLDEAIPATMYFSYLQSMDVGMRMAVRTSSDPRALVTPIRAVIRDLDPGVGTYQVYTMDELMGQSQSVFLRRYPLVLVGTFALVALVLALVGTYGVISYAVSQRLREIGIRIALGARPGAIRWLVLRHAGVLAAVGVAVGAAAAVALSRLAASLMYGVRGSEPAIFAAVAALLGTMALAAAFLPARRATRADPLVAVKAE